MTNPFENSTQHHATSTSLAFPVINFGLRPDVIQKYGSLNPDSDVDVLLQCLERDYGHLDASTRAELLENLKTIGLTDEVVECVAARWQAVDATLGGGMDCLLLQTSAVAWTEEIIYGIIRSGFVAEGQVYDGTKYGKEGQDKRLKSSGSSVTPIDPTSKANQIEKLTAYPDDDTPRRSPPSKLNPTHPDQHPAQSERLHTAWKENVTTVLVSTVEDLRTSELLERFVQKENVMKEEDLWEALNEEQSIEVYVFHGTTVEAWTDGFEKWQFGFDLNLSVETVSQLSRRRAIYTSNSFSYGIYYGAYRSGVSRFDLPFDTTSAVVIAVKIDTSKLVNVAQSAALAILQPGHETEKFISINKNRALPLPRITPPWNGGIHRCSCPSFSPAKRCCLHHFIYGPFRHSDQNELRMNAYKEKWGGVSVDEIRQLCAATNEAGSLLNTFPATAIVYSANVSTTETLNEPTGTEEEVSPKGGSPEMVKL